jgi:hypothetical protein
LRLAQYATPDQAEGTIQWGLVPSLNSCSSMSLDQRLTHNYLKDTATISLRYANDENESGKTRTRIMGRVC